MFLTTDVLTIQLHFHVPTCTEWIVTEQLGKLQEIAFELVVYVRKRCDCPFQSSSIISPGFTCQQQPPYVKYSASVVVSMISREVLVSALKEWPSVHRSILIHGEKLSVEEECPVIIQSADGVCEITTAPEALSTLLIVTAALGALGVLLLITILLSCVTWKWR
jgi:hypothetical protein